MMEPGRRDRGPEGRDLPWDHLSVPEPGPLDDGVVVPADDVVTSVEGVSPWARMAAGWADLVVVGIMTTSILLGVLTAGYAVRTAALPWAAGIAVLWWLLCSVFCIRIRRGTPGMLIAGIVFDSEVAGVKIVRTVMAAGFIAVLLGIPALPGGRRRSMFSLASGSALTSVAPPGADV